MRKILLVLFLLFLLLLFYFSNSKNKDSISIGYQSITAQTWGAIVIKEFNLLEEELGNDDINISWSNFASGPPITSNMLAGKIQIGFMGDMPLLINGDLAQNNEYYDSYLAYLDGKGLNGANQNVMVLPDSPIEGFQDLSDKTVSVPNSSSAHRNLLQDLYLVGISEDQLDIIFQDIPTAIIMLENQKIDAISVWEPYPTYLEIEKDFRSLKKKDNIKYLAGVVIDKNWKNTKPEYEKAFGRALKRAHEMLSDPSNELISVVSDETGFSEDVVRQVITNITWESAINEDDIVALQEDVSFLQSLDKISLNFDLNEFLSK